MTIQELSEEMRKKRARCSTYCATWNREDRDCEIYGNYHQSPSRCMLFLVSELEKRRKAEEEQ